MSYNKDEHRTFLLKKKQEILQQKESVATKPAPSSAIAQNTVGPKIPFANDGSFLARFQEMQRKKAAEIKPDPDSSSSTLSSLPKKEIIQVQKAKPNSTKTFELKNSASIFIKEEEVDGDYNSDYDVAKQLAEKVAEEGLQEEAQARLQYQNDSRYQFLFNPSSDVAKFYQSQIKSLKYAPENSKKRRWDSSAAESSSISAPSCSKQSSSTIASVNPLFAFEQAKALVRAKAAALMGGGGGAAVNIKTEEDIKMEKDIEEQRLMQDIYRKVIEQQVAAAQEQSKKKKKSDKDKPKYAYDSDEETEGGTWEHKKRTDEMAKTQEWAMDLTSSAKGKHHLADFLPPDELEKFFEKVKAVKEGREADFSDYSKYRIQDDNVGFKMLQKAGWKEGTGLGTKGEGITEPINKGKVSFDQAGIGADKPATIQKEDDDFELYRKRMMLSYKFRPNPLNNPRRPYY